jgi:hypothetical protein
MLAAFGGSGYANHQSGVRYGAGTPFVVVCSATFFCTRKNASHFSLSGAKKRHIPPERYAKFQPICCKINKKILKYVNL